MINTLAHFSNNGTFLGTFEGDLNSLPPPALIAEGEYLGMPRTIVLPPPVEYDQSSQTIDLKPIGWVIRDLSPEELNQKFQSLTQQFDSKTQERLDSFAQQWGFESMDRATSYFNSTVKKWRDEARELIAWRDQTWLAAYEVFNSVSSGQRGIPTLEEYLGELPDFPERP
jgi:hypothetical protein